MSPDNSGRLAGRSSGAPSAMAARPEQAQTSSAAERRIAALIQTTVRDPHVRHFLAEALLRAGQVREAIERDAGSPGAVMEQSRQVGRSLARAYGAAPVGERPAVLASAIGAYALARQDPGDHRPGRLEARVCAVERSRARQARFDAATTALVNSFGDTPELQIILGLSVLCARATLAGRRDLLEHADRLRQRLVYAFAEHRVVFRSGNLAHERAGARATWAGAAEHTARPDAPHGSGSWQDGTTRRALEHVEGGTRQDTARESLGQERDRDAQETNVPRMSETKKAMRGQRAGASGQRGR
jgi:hypothetical protein